MFPTTPKTWQAQTLVALQGAGDLGGGELATPNFREFLFPDVGEEEEKGGPGSPPASTLDLKLPYSLRNFGLPILFCPLPEHLPSGLHGHHGVRLYPASVVQLRTEQCEELLRIFNVH
jgi:hypothetical protein